MSVTEQDIICYGSANMPDADGATVGGAIQTNTKISFSDLSTACRIGVVANQTETTQVHVTGRNSAGELIGETITCNGTTIVYASTNATWERLLKAVRATSGNTQVAVISSGGLIGGLAHSGVAQAMSSGVNNSTITLVATGSATDNAYQGKILRIKSSVTAGLTGYLGEITSYNGTTKVAQLRPFVSGVDNSACYEIHDGMLLESYPSVILTVRRPFYNVAADVSGGSQRTFCEKVFLKNTNASTALTTAQTLISYDGTTNKVSYALSSGMLADSNTIASRLNTLPTSISGWPTAASGALNIYGGNHSVGSGVAVWLLLTLPAGSAAQNTYFTLRETGQTT